MIITIQERPDNFEKIVSGQLTFVTDAGIEYKAVVGDYLAINEYKSGEGYTRRCCLAEVSEVIELEECYIYAIQPCRIETHRRLTAAVYGEKEGGSDE